MTNETNRGWAAIMLARELEVCRSILDGRRVLARQLDVVALRRALRGSPLPDPGAGLDSGRKHTQTGERDGKGTSGHQRVRADRAELLPCASAARRRLRDRRSERPARPLAAAPAGRPA